MTKIEIINQTGDEITIVVKPEDNVEATSLEMRPVENTVSGVVGDQPTTGVAVTPIETPADVSSPVEPEVTTSPAEATVVESVDASQIAPEGNLVPVDDVTAQAVEEINAQS